MIDRGIAYWGFTNEGCRGPFFNFLSLLLLLLLHFNPLRGVFPLPGSFATPCATSRGNLFGSFNRFVPRILSFPHLLCTEFSKLCIRLCLYSRKFRKPRFLPINLFLFLT